MPTRDEFTALAIFFGLFGLVLGAAIWLEVRLRARLNAWLAEHAMELVRKELRKYRRGPFNWSFEWFTPVYLLTVRDKAGHEREVWVAINALDGSTKDSWVD